MSSLAVTDAGQLRMAEQTAKPIKDRIRQAREHKQQFEANWALNLAYAAGDHWSVWDNQQRTLRKIQDVDPRYRGRELYTADVITEYRTTALGELGGDNDRPQLMLVRDDAASEKYQEQLNRAVEFGWNHEWDGDVSLAEVDRFLVDLGTAAVRCRFDPTVGPVKADNVPHVDGRPILDNEEAVQQVAAAAAQGQTLQFKPIKQGRICWEAISALGLLVPPGVTHEDKFPWEAIVRPAYLPDVKERYGDLADDLEEDNDIRSDLGLTTSGARADSALTWGLGGSRQTRLRDHVWLFTYYERPSQKYPKGRTVTLASNRMKMLEYVEELPYVAPDGSYRSGIAYFHWWRVTGRFWSRSLLDVMRDPQRGIDKRRTQINEIIDRGMPYVFVEKGSQAKQRIGYPMEMIEIGPQERPPIPSSGIAPGPWMQADVEALREDLEHATGLRGPRLGENPAGVTTYSQLALINEQETTKRNPTRADRQRAITQLIEDSVYDMRTYWGPERQLLLAGDNDQAEATEFNATKIPPFFIVSAGKGTPAPRTQAAKIQLVTDIANFSITAMQPVPLKWFKESLEAGEPLELPQQEVEDPADKAELENHLMNQGQPMPIAYYDPAQIHLPIHRRAQDDAMFARNTELWQRIEAHCQLHINAALAQQQAVMDQQAQAQAQQQLTAGPNGNQPAPAGATPSSGGQQQ